MLESEIQSRVMLAVGALPGVRLFRNNTGTAWQGVEVEKTTEYLLLKNYRRINFGLCQGSSDLIGWNQNGLFTALEVKSSTGRASADQLRFIARVTESGGLAAIVRSSDEALRLFS